MKLVALISALALAGTSLHAAESAPADDIKAAAKKLAGQSYSWKSTTEMAGGGGGGQWRPGPTEGRITADGTMALSMTRGDNTIEALMKGGRTAVKTPEGWQAPPEPGTGGGGGGPGGAGMMGRMLTNMRPPAAEAEDLVGKVEELRKTEDGFTGDLTEEGAKQLLTRNRRGGGGGEPPAPQDAKGSVKFWLKDGVLAKYEVQVQGRVAGRDGQEMDVNRTTTVEISNVGTTKVEVAEEAKKVLG